MSIDWSNIENLRFRESLRYKIIEVIVFQSEKGLTLKKPVYVCYEEVTTGACQLSIDGCCLSNETPSQFDIIERRFNYRPMNFAEIAKLFIDYGHSILVRRCSEPSDNFFCFDKIDFLKQSFFSRREDTWVGYYFFSEGIFEYSIDNGKTFQGFYVKEEIEDW